MIEDITEDEKRDLKALAAQYDLTVIMAREYKNNKVVIRVRKKSHDKHVTTLEKYRAWSPTERAERLEKLSKEIDENL